MQHEKPSFCPARRSSSERHQDIHIAVYLDRQQVAYSTMRQMVAGFNRGAGGSRLPDFYRDSAPGGLEMSSLLGTPLYERFMSAVRREIVRTMRMYHKPPRVGMVSSYDPTNHAVKVQSNPRGRSPAGFLRTG